MNEKRHEFVRDFYPLSKVVASYGFMLAFAWWLATTKTHDDLPHGMHLGADIGLVLFGFMLLALDLVKTYVVNEREKKHES